MAGMKLRFSIRDLLWLAALVAVCVAWWVDHNRYGKYKMVTGMYGGVRVYDPELDRLIQISPDHPENGDNQLRDWPK